MRIQRAVQLPDGSMWPDPVEDLRDMPGTDSADDRTDLRNLAIAYSLLVFMSARDRKRIIAAIRKKHMELLARMATV